MSPTKQQAERMELLGLAALAWYLADREAREARLQRTSMRCEEAEPGEPETGAPGRPPCWQSVADEAEWCEPCRRRQAVHASYGEAAAKSQAALQRLRRAGERAARAVGEAEGSRA